MMQILCAGWNSTTLLSNGRDTVHGISLLETWRSFALLRTLSNGNLKGQINNGLIHSTLAQLWAELMCLGCALVVSITVRKSLEVSPIWRHKMWGSEERKHSAWKLLCNLWVEMEDGFDICCSLGTNPKLKFRGLEGSTTLKALSSHVGKEQWYWY